MNNTFLLETYNFDLPDSCIADSPVVPRDNSKLLVYSNKKISDAKFNELASFLPENTVLILNDTRVLKARLKFLVKNKLVEVFFVEKIADFEFRVLVKPGKLFKINFEFLLPGELPAKVTSIDAEGFRVIKLSPVDDSFDLNSYLEKFGEIPLPPYIKVDNPSDYDEKYQTVYANQYGSIAAPTAGLHFTPELIQKLISIGFKFEYVTLNVGIGTFMPVKVENILDHQMHSEMFTMSEETAKRLNQYKQESRFFVAVGTTTMRVLQSSYDFDKNLFVAKSSNTDIFIYPGYNDFIVDALVTNFHLPKSTLFMLVSAIVGIDNAKDIYSHAILNGYKFYSFGDSSLLFI